MSETEPPVQVPNTLEGVGIHLSYIRRDVDGISKKLDGLTTSFVTTVEFEEARKQSEKDRSQLNRSVEFLNSENTKRKEFQDTLTGKMIAMSGITGILIAGITLIANHYWK